MQDHPTSSGAGQPCSNPGAHLLPHAIAAAVTVPFTNRGREYRLRAIPAVLGQPCLGIFQGPPIDRPIETTLGAIVLLGEPVRFQFHAYEIALTPDVPTVALTTHRISVRATPDWGEHFTYQLNGLTPEEVTNFLTLWSESWRQIRVGQPQKVTAETAPELAARIRTAYRDCVRDCGNPSPSQLHRVNSHTATIGYSSTSGLEEHLKKLRSFNYRWPESFR
jgi:hypothetical protein